MNMYSTLHYQSSATTSTHLNTNFIFALGSSYNQQQQQQETPVNPTLSLAYSHPHARLIPHQEQQYFQRYYSHYASPQHHNHHAQQSNPTNTMHSPLRTLTPSIQHISPHHIMQYSSLYGRNYPVTTLPRNRSAYISQRNVPIGGEVDRIHVQQQQHQQQSLIAAPPPQPYAHPSPSTSSSGGSERQQWPPNIRALEQASSAPSSPQYRSLSPARGRPPRRRPSYPVLLANIRFLRRTVS